MDRARSRPGLSKAQLDLQETPDVSRGDEVGIRLPDVLDLPVEQAVCHRGLQQIIGTRAAAAHIGFRQFNQP